MKTLTHRLAASLLLTLATLAAGAQTYVLTGKVIDREAQMGIDYATVRLMTPKDSTMIAGTNTEEDGTFVLSGAKPGKYILRLSYIGYRSIYQELTLPEAPADSARQLTDTLRLGDLTMYSDTYVLRAAVVRASVAKVQQVGDTTMFNADAYRTAEGATLEALVKQLPGAEVGDDGSITINGKQVSEILVNGKDFFKGDTETAMKNLPVDLVKKIKTYDKKSDYAEQTGIDDGNDSFVLDIMTKHELNESWISNIDLAGGWDYHDRGLYSGKLFVSRFSDHSRVTLVASHNNIGDNGFGGPRGMGGGGGGNGININTMVGVDFNWENGRKKYEGGKLELGGSARYTRRENTTESTTSSETFLTTNRDRSFSNSHSWGGSLAQGIQANLRLQWSPDSLTSISFRPNYSWSKSRSHNSSINATFDKDPFEQFPDAGDADDILGHYFNTQTHAIKPDTAYADFLVNLRDNASRSESQSHSVGANLSATRRLLGKQGRNISFQASGNYSHSRNSSYSLANVLTRQGNPQQGYTHNLDNSTHQFTTTPSTNWNVSVGGGYVEPIVGKLYGELRYTYNHRFNDQTRTLWNLYDFAQPQTSIGRIVAKYQGTTHAAYFHPSGSIKHTGSVSDERDIPTTDLLNQFLLMNPDDVLAALRDNQNSQYATYKYDNHSINLGLRYNEGDIRLSAGVSFNPEHTRMDYTKGAIDTLVTRNVFNVAPQVRFRWNMTRNRRLELNFRGSSSQPSMTNLLEVIDTSNPLRISTGNAGLKPSWNTSLSANFNDYNADRQQSWAANWNFSHTRNTISTLSIYDRETGRTFSSPQNIKGHWNTALGLMFSSALGYEKLWNISTHSNFRYNHSTAYVSTDADAGIVIPAIYTNESISRFFAEALPYAKTNINRTTNLSESLALSYRQSLWDISANGRVNYQHSRSQLQSNGNMDTWGFDYGVSGNVTLDCGFAFSTDIRMNSRRGYSSKSLNTNELLWNAQISQSFLKGRPLTVMLQFYDILGQQSNISRTINATMRSDSWHMALNSYMMLHVIYKFNIFSGQHADDTEAQGSKASKAQKAAARHGRGADEAHEIMRQSMPRQGGHGPLM
ncbi:MAG: TonB-dependent receptor [Bacteroidales bacterium]|nr:TonB-dependent receptor [Candidatus Equimonas faecalis]